MSIYAIRLREEYQRERKRSALYSAKATNIRKRATRLLTDTCHSVVMPCLAPQPTRALRHWIR